MSPHTFRFRAVSALLTAGFAFAGAPSAAQEIAASQVTLVSLDTAARPEADGPGTAAPADQAPSDTTSVTRPRVTVTSGMDAASSYMFRGLYQEDRGVVAPAFLDVKIPLFAGAGRLSAVRANVGMWNSFHSGPTGAQGRANAWYEADYYASVTATAGRWSPGMIFTLVTSPNTAFNTVYELGASLDYDDSDSRFPLAPRVFFVAELAGQMDSGQTQGRYLEASVKPVRPLGQSGPMAFAVAIPVKTGGSLQGYYESGQPGTPFFASAGVIPSVAVTGPRVSFEVHAGLEFMRLGAAPSAFNGGHRNKPIVTVGASVTY